MLSISSPEIHKIQVPSHISTIICHLSNSPNQRAATDCLYCSPPIKNILRGKSTSTKNP